MTWEAGGAPQRGVQGRREGRTRGGTEEEGGVQIPHTAQSGKLLLLTTTKVIRDGQPYTVKITIKGYSPLT